MESNDFDNTYLKFMNLIKYEISDELMFHMLNESKYDKDQINQIIKAKEKNIYLAIHNFFDVNTIRKMRKIIEDNKDRDKYTLENELNTITAVIESHDSKIYYVHYFVSEKDNIKKIFSVISQINDAYIEEVNFYTKIRYLTSLVDDDNLIKRHMYNDYFKLLFPITKEKYYSILNNIEELGALQSLLDYIRFNSSNSFYADIIEKDIELKRMPTYQHLLKLNDFLAKHRFKKDKF